MPRRIPSLDGLRAISITLVLLGHLVGTRNFPAELSFLKPYAYLGVRVFFVISGYLITKLLLEERDRQEPSTCWNSIAAAPIASFPRHTSTCWRWQHFTGSH